jgi:hypothetical protein
LLKVLFHNFYFYAKKSFFKKYRLASSAAPKTCKNGAGERRRRLAETGYNGKASCMKTIIFLLGFCCLMFGCSASKMNYPKTYNYIYKNFYAANLAGIIQFKANGQFIFCDGFVYKGSFKISKDSIFMFPDSSFKGYNDPADYYIYPSLFIIKDKKHLLKCARVNGKYLPLFENGKQNFTIFNIYPKKILISSKGYCQELLKD